MKAFKEIYQQIVSQQPNWGGDNLLIVQHLQQQKVKIRDDKKAIAYEEKGTIENKEKYVALDGNYKIPIRILSSTPIFPSCSFLNTVLTLLALKN